MEIDNKLEDNLKDMSGLIDLHSDPVLEYDLITCLLGAVIGEGAFRKVYDYNLDDSCVIKIEGNDSNCNIVEAMIWGEVKQLQGDLDWVKKWFAPVVWISPNGRVLVMKKTGEGKIKELPPEKIPSFLWDVKLDNFGWYKDSFVCHDYGQFYNMIHYPKRMRKANWYV